MHTSHPAAGPGARLTQSRAALWVAFVIVHGALIALGLGPLRASTFFDVEIYRSWISFGFDNNTWPVLGYDWVYPVLALIPMLLAWMLSATTTGYLVAWCLLVTALNATALGVVLRHVPRHAAPSPDDLDPDELGAEQLTPPHRPLAAGWFFVLFLACLGTVSIGRIDAVAAPLATIALCLALRRPTVAGALATVGAWIKIFPGAIFLTLVLVSRRARLRVIAAGAAVSAVIVLGVVALGGGSHLLSFLTGQEDRGLQLESTLGTPLVVGRAIAGLPVSAYNPDINTNEIPGHLSGLVGSWANVILVVLVLLTGLLVWFARTNPTQVLPLAALAISLAMIVGNKVGSPQFLCALAPAVIVALTRPHPGRQWRAQAGFTLALAAITQVIFPWCYPQLEAGQLFAVGLLAARNLGLLVLLGWTLWRLAGLALAGREGRAGQVRAALVR